MVTGRLFWLTLVFSLGTGFANVNSARAVPMACVAQNFQKYRDLGATGCTISDKLFFNFDITRGLGKNGGIYDDRGPNTAQIMVTPVGAGTNNPGFTFSASTVEDGKTVYLWDTGALMGVFLNTITFSVEVQNDKAKIKDASLEDTASRELKDSATAGVSATLCLGSFTTPCPRGTPVSLLRAPLDKNHQTNSDSKTFDPVTKVGVSLIVTSTSLNPDAGVKEFTVRFSEVPEPSSGLLLLTSVVAIGLFLRRRSAHGTPN